MVVIEGEGRWVGEVGWVRVWVGWVRLLGFIFYS